MIVFWKFTTPERKELTYNETWFQEDKGLIKNYEKARDLAIKKPELAAKAKRNELPLLGYKGGSDKKLKKKTKFGSLNYLAQWQALRGENLNIDLSKEIVITCSKTNIKVTFTGDLKKLSSL